MRIAVVGTHDGKPYIRWGPALFVTCVLAIFASGGAFGIYYLLTGTVSPLAALVGLAGAVTAVGSGIRRAMKDPVTTEDGQPVERPMDDQRTNRGG